MSQWVMATFAQWLAGIGLEQREAPFAANDIDLDVAMLRPGVAANRA